MYKYIQFDVLALENLKLGKFEKDSNNEYSYSYIPGSVIKGAVVWDIAQRKCEVPKEILNGSTIFYNAYPLVNGLASNPMMKGFLGDKQQIRSGKGRIEVRHSFNKREETDAPLTCYEFAAGREGEENCLLGYNPEKVGNIHINKKDASNNDKNPRIFRYEAIKKGEQLRGYIRVPKMLSDHIFEALGREYVYFGGSRGSGYGKCRIENIKQIPKVSPYESDPDIKDELYIYFLSDAILYYNGKVNTYIPEAQLKKFLGINGECKYIASCNSLEFAASYNTLYRTNTICYSAVSKGSIAKYTVDEKIEPDKIKSLVEAGVGLRREDGYGHIAILNKIPDDISVIGYKRTGPVQSPKFAIGSRDFDITDEDRDIVNTILKNIFKNRSKLEVEKIVLELLKDWNRPGGSLQSQVGKLLNIFQNGYRKEESDFKRALRDYLEEMRAKRGKIAWFKLEQLKFPYGGSKTQKGNLGLTRMLKDFTDDRSNVLFDSLQHITITGVKLGEFKFPSDKKLEKEALHNLKMDFFTCLLRHFLRMKEVVS